MKKKDAKKAKHRQTQRAGAGRPPAGVANGIRYPDTPQRRRRRANPHGGQARPSAEDKARHKSRKEIRHQKNRSRLITFVLVCILLVICVFISLKVLFIVQKVEVQGTERYTAEEIIGFCAIPMEENIFRIDTEAIVAGLPENFTYIESATAQRKLPNKIVITVTDAVPTYYMEQIGEDGATTVYTIYSKGFKAITTQAAAPEELIKVELNTADRECTETFNQLVEMLARGGWDSVSKISLPSVSEISVEYGGRITVNLGTMLDMSYKLKMALHVITTQIPREESGVIDATSSGNVVYKMTRKG